MKTHAYSSNRIVFRWVAGLTLAAASLLQPLQAALLYSENFDSYTAGSSIAGANGGTGWNSAWSITNPANGTALVTSQAESPGFDDGNTLTITPTAGTIYAYRALDGTISSGTVYFSVLVDNVSDGTRFLSFELYNESGASVGYFGQRSGTTIWGMYFGANGDTSFSSINLDAPTLLVLRVDFDYSSTKVQVSLFVNPALGEQEPSTPSASLVVSKTGFNIASISLGSGYTNGTLTTSVARFDDVAIATTWSSIPEPSSWALMGLGLGALVIFRRRRTNS